MKNDKTAFTIMMVIGGMVGVWSSAAFISALKHSDWQVSQLVGKYLVSIGVIKEFNTLVEFYTHIKGIEYLVCVIFFVAFPVFYKYLNKPSKIVTR